MYRNNEYQPFRGAERSDYGPKPKGAAPPRPAPKPAPAKGSITLGTPVEARFDSRRTPPDPKTGTRDVNVTIIQKLR